MKRIIIVITALSALISCTARYDMPNVSLPDEYPLSEGWITDSLGVDFAWWEHFDDPVLTGLIMQAISGNRNLAVAASRIEQARLNLGNVRSDYAPSFVLDVSAQGDYTRRTKTEQEYTIMPSMSWEIPLFGALRNSTAEAEAQLGAAKWAFRGVMLSLTAEVADTYFTLLQYRSSLETARNSYRSRSRSTAMIDSMYRYGMSSAVDLQQARSLTASAAVDIPMYERAIVETAFSLSLLLGRYPTDSIVGSALALNADAVPVDIPIGLPSDLLERRPDVQEAYCKVGEAAAEIALARIERFPSISLTAAGGILSPTVRDITSSNSLSWNALAKLTQPIFSFGKLKRNEMSARENYFQAVEQYEQTVLQAFSDVGEALSQIDTYTRQVERYAAMVEANERISEMISALYRDGMSSYLDVLDAERTLYASQMEYAEVRAQQYMAYVALYKALGGGW